MSMALAVSVGLFAAGSLVLAPASRSDRAFYRGSVDAAGAPGLWTLTLSLVTTWIFARSLLNAAILGFVYGPWGTLAYAGYYLSFLTGARIVDSVRFRHGCTSIQDFLARRFGRVGTWSYNLVIAVRLLSEVFANLLVIGILFGQTGSAAAIWSMVAFALVALIYSARGGLQASLRTDVLQMLLFIVVLLILGVLALADPVIAAGGPGFGGFAVPLDDPGPVLLVVALLQVWSYPMHDPVMMDRGFLSDRRTTWRAFHHAAWISILCIMAFGWLGVLAGLHAQDGEDVQATLTRLLGAWPMLLFALALAISAMSTLDSALASVARLLAVETGLMPATIRNGRIVMALFMLLGLVLSIWGTSSLYAAVAVSGTASMYLVPVIVYSVWLDRPVPVWSYLCSLVL
ncbi:MAG: sodium:proline symporter, partial [Planctomycetota bacterium]